MEIKVEINGIETNREKSWNEKPALEEEEQNCGVK